VGFMCSSVYPQVTLVSLAGSSVVGLGIQRLKGEENMLILLCSVIRLEYTCFMTTGKSASWSADAGELQCVAHA
jgi:hypothetical protein